MTEKYKVLPDSNGKWCIVSESPAGMFCFHVHERFDDKAQAERICHLMNRDEGAKLDPRLRGDDRHLGSESPEPLVGDIEASVTVTPPAGLGLQPFEIRWGDIPAAPDNIAFCTPAAVGKSEQLSGDVMSNVIDRINERLCANAEMIKAFPESVEVSDLVHRNDRVLTAAAARIEELEAELEAELAADDGDDDE